MPVSQRPLLGLVLALLTLPGYATAFALPSLRPNPAWTYNQAIRVHVVRIVVQLLSLLRPVTRLSMLAGNEKTRFQVIPPAPADYYYYYDYDYHTGNTSSIQPGPVGGTWYPKEPARARARARSEAGQATAVVVILHFHGGGYVLGDGRERDAGFAARCLLEAYAGRQPQVPTTTTTTTTTTTYVLCPQYRLSGPPEGRFPAALQDGITAYAHLVLERGIAPSNIIVSGDSAGGNLALALVRYLEQQQRRQQQHPLSALPVPGNLWLWSPWLNAVAPLQDTLAHDRSPRAATDYTTSDFGHWATHAFIPPEMATSLLATAADDDEENNNNNNNNNKRENKKKKKNQSNDIYKYIHPLGNPFATSAAVFICAGECEIFLHDNLEFARQMQAVDGKNQVRTFVIPNAPHDVLLMGDKIGFEAAARLGARAAVQCLT